MTITATPSNTLTMTTEISQKQNGQTAAKKPAPTTLQDSLSNLPMKPPQETPSTTIPTPTTAKATLQTSQA